MLTSKVTFGDVCGGSQAAGAVFNALPVAFIKPGMANLARGRSTVGECGGGELRKESLAPQINGCGGKAMTLERLEVEGTDL